MSQLNGLQVKLIIAKLLLTCLDPFASTINLPGDVCLPLCPAFLITDTQYVQSSLLVELTLSIQLVIASVSVGYFKNCKRFPCLFFFRFSLANT